MSNIFASGAAAMKDNYIYFSARDYNALLRVDINTNKLDYLGQFSVEKCPERIHSKAYTYNENIWFIPLFGENIACLNTVTNAIEYFEIADSFFYEGVMANNILKDSKGNIFTPKFLDAGFIDEHNLFLVPADLHDLVIIDLFNCKVTNIPLEINLYDELFGVGICYGNEIWLIPYWGEEILIVDYKTQKTHRLSKPKGLGRFFGGTAVKDTIIFTDRMDELICYSANTYKMSKKSLNIGMQLNKYGVRDMTVINDNLFLFPLDSGVVVHHNMKSGETKTCIFSNDINLGTLQLISTNNDAIFFISYTYGFWGEINSKGETRINYFDISKKDMVSLLTDNFTRKGKEEKLSLGIFSEELIPVEVFLKFI